MKLARWSQINLTQIRPVERARTGCFISRVCCLMTTRNQKRIQTATTTNAHLLVFNDPENKPSALFELDRVARFERQ